MKKKRVVVGLSGGVDSAVSATMLKKQGFDVLGVFLYCYDGRVTACTVEEDRAMAVKVADFLHIPIKIIDLRSQYRRSVIDYFFAEYQKGRTPNPDVMCNKEIKFGIFYDQVINEWGYDYVATGHYARIIRCSIGNKADKLESDATSRYCLAKGIDDGKDQSYFLYRLKENQLEHILFPIGDLKKEMVRKTAKQIKLPNWEKPDSQGICFIGEVDIKKFLMTEIKPQKGLVLNTKGEVIGEHEGVYFYTIGQRHGFKITNNLKLITNNKNVKPLYILNKDSVHNTLTVGNREDLNTNIIITEPLHLINDHINPIIFKSNKFQARIRHLGELYDCKIEKVSKNGESVIKLDKPAFAVAPGQSVVIYNKDIVVGGGVIK